MINKSFQKDAYKSLNKQELFKHTYPQINSKKKKTNKLTYIKFNIQEM